jgi:hypothetical protein
MAKMSPAPKVSSQKFSLPKLPMARAMSESAASRSTASSYGKLAKMGASKMKIPIE